MAQHYQLPCPECSETLLVTTTQAGETRSCTCGASITVPTLREMRQLDTVDDEADQKSNGGWSRLRGGLFVAGMLLIAIGAIGHWQVQPQREAIDTSTPKFEELRIDLDALTPMGAWQAWEHFRDQTLEFRVTPEFLENRAKYRELSRYLYFLWGLAAIGVLLVISSLVAKQI